MIRSRKTGILVFNPTAGQRDRRSSMAELIGSLREKGIDLVSAPTSGPGDATTIVRENLPHHPDVIAVCGGDGTVSEAAAALLGTEVPLAILPGGTSNVLALELAIPFDLRLAAGLIETGVPRRLRAGVANGRPFLLMAGVGLDARIMGKMSLKLKKWLGRAGIFFTAVEEFLKYEFPALEVEIDGVNHAATFAVVCKSRHYAGDWIAAPEASPESDSFDTVLFESKMKKDLVRLFAGMKGGRGAHLNSGFARVVRGRRVTVSTRERDPIEVQLDGDCVMETPVTCTIAEGTVSVLAPARKAARI